MAGRWVCQWDKDSVDDARIVKIDFLALGMLSAVDECLDTSRRSRRRVSTSAVSRTTAPRFTTRSAKATPSASSRSKAAPRSQTLPHTQPKNLDDLAVQVAIVRPGPIVRGAFHPYMEYRERGPRRGRRHGVWPPGVRCWNTASKKRWATCSTRTRCSRLRWRSRVSAPARRTCCGAR